MIRVSVRFESVISIESRHLKLLNHKFVTNSNLDDNYMYLLLTNLELANGGYICC